MFEQIQAFIAQHDLLTRNRPVLVAVSGGIDSIAVLHILKSLGYEVICAHFDHQLRPDSAADLNFVRGTAAAWNIPFTAGTADVAAFRAEMKLSVEEAARELRYRFLFEQARLMAAQCVVTGHTADDQAETVLMNFIRGAGLRGLKGMRPKSSGLQYGGDRQAVVRPLLGTYRHEIVAFQAKAGFPFREDPSNDDPAFTRNRLRHELIPLLENYNPAFKEAAVRTAAVMAIDDEALADFSRRGALWSVRKWGRAIGIDVQRFRRLPGAIRGRVLRDLAARKLYPAPIDFDYAATRRGLELLLSGKSSGHCDLVGGLSLFLEDGVGWIAARREDLPSTDWPQLEDTGRLQICVPGETALNEGWVLLAEQINVLPAAWDRQEDPTEIFLPADGPQLLYLRKRQRGDRFRPLGMEGHSMSLSDLMINEKLPKRARAGWPLVVSEDSILWVVGKKRSADFPIKIGAGAFVRLKLLRR